jgi:uncharacterized protein (TIGR00255 family)
MPPFLNPLEPKIRELITGGVQRGRVEVYIKIRELTEAVTVHLDKPVVESYVKVLEELAAAAKLDEKPALSDLLSMEGILKTDKQRDLDFYWSHVKNRFSEAFQEFEVSRIQEGAQTEADIRELLSGIEKNVAILEEHAPELETHIVETLKERFEQLMGDDYDESRVFTETAVLLVKYNVNEEIMRMKSHLQSFRQIADGDAPVGKKLDFLCQELNREINTIGSKSTILEVNQSVIEVKDAIEKIREQLRNVE